MSAVTFYKIDKPIGTVQYDGGRITTHPQPGHEHFFENLIKSPILAMKDGTLQPIGPEAGEEWLRALPTKFRNPYLCASESA